MDPIKLYLRDIKNIPLLTPKEEIDLAKAIKKGDVHARRQMIRSNLRLVINIAKRYSRFGVPMMDLIEEGNLGLMKAVTKFDPHLGFRFSTYAAWWIKQHITRALADQGKTVRIPVYMVENLSKLRKVQERLTNRYRRKPKVSEIARSMRTPVANVRELLELSQSTSSLDAPVGEEDETTILDLIEDPKAQSPSEEMGEFLKQERVRRLLDKLTPREKEILILRFGLRDGEEKTLDDTAKKFGITRERVRQIEAACLRRLKKMIMEEEKRMKETALT